MLGMSWKWGKFDGERIKSDEKNRNIVRGNNLRVKGNEEMHVLNPNYWKIEI